MREMEKNTCVTERRIMPNRILLERKARVFAAFMDFIGTGTREDTILDVGIAECPTMEHRLSALLTPERLASVTCCDISLHGEWSAGLEITLLPAVRKLPFQDGAFDWVFCNGVIEKLAGFELQYELLRELGRVARKGVYVTAANRWHPIEFNTGLPLLHWLPARWWQRMLAWTRRGTGLSGTGSSLLDAGLLMKLVNLLPGKNAAAVGHIRYFGVKGLLFLQLEKPATLAAAADRHAA